MAAVWGVQPPAETPAGLQDAYSLLDLCVAIVRAASGRIFVEVPLDQGVQLAWAVVGAVGNATPKLRLKNEANQVGFWVSIGRLEQPMRQMSCGGKLLKIECFS